MLTAKDHLKIFCLSILVGFCSLLLSVSVLMFDAFDEASEDAEDFLSQVEAVIFHGKRSFQQLNQIQTTPCSLGHQTAMREILFDQIFVRDIGYRKTDGGGCSVSLGNFDNELGTSQLFDKTASGFLIDFKRFDGVYNKNFDSLTVSDGHYDLIYAAQFLQTLKTPSPNSELVYAYGKQVIHIAGTESLFTGKIKSALDWLWSEGQQVELCSGKEYFCVATRSSHMEWIIANCDFLAFLLLLNLIFVIFVHRLLTSYSLARRSIRSRVRRGLFKQSFYTLYQPIVTLNNKRVVGCEVLSRFKDEYGEIFPDQFIPVIQDLGFTWQFSESMIEGALLELAAEKDLPEGFRVSFNLYPNDVASGKITNILNLPAVNSTRFRLVFEITEDEFLDEDKSAVHLARLVNEDYLIAIDDFGKGYSNLQQIKKINSQLLKIDRSFISELEEGSIRASFIPAIIDIANKSNLYLIAEGIETEMQHQQLLIWGIEYGQGWLYGKPMASDALVMTREVSGDYEYSESTPALDSATLKA